jgi:hypothetical protein
MTGIMCALAGGSGIYSGFATVTVGQYVDVSFTVWGYSSGLAGSVSPATWAGTGATIEQLGWFDAGVDFVALRVDAGFPNEGWTTMTVDGVPFTRVSASYATDSTYTIWNWITASNPFGTTIGATKAVTWS